MIVKNEAPRLGAALESILPLVPDAYVLDTGSTDDTPAILEAAQRKFPHLRYSSRPWEGMWHFSEARNLAAARAKHDWILVLDGDEVWSGPLPPPPESPDVGVALDVECIGDTEGHSNHLRGIRIYNRTKVGWKGRVHNQLRGLTGVEYAPGPCILSYYTGRLEEKAARSIPLLLAQSEDGDEEERRIAQFFLAKTYYALQQWEDCYPVAQAALDALTPEDSAMVDVVVWCAYSALFLHGPPAMQAALDQGRAIFPDSPHIAQATVAHGLVVWAGLGKMPHVQQKYGFAGLTSLRPCALLPQVAEALEIPLNLASVSVGVRSR